MFAMTLIHFTILALRGSAMYNYYHSYADRAALYDWLHSLHLTAPAGSASSGGLLEWLGYIVHGDRADLANSNVASVANSILNMLGTAVTIVVILLSPPLSKRFGKKNIAVAGFGLTTLTSAAFYFLTPDNVNGMVWLTIIGSIVYAPTIPLVWAMFADVADYSEWKNGRRATGVIFATIGFALKAGLSLGSASFLWIMALCGYAANQPQTAATLQGIRLSSSVIVAGLFGLCTILLAIYKINEPLSRQVARELAERRGKSAF
jgi:Na+/melibiose symporter-like transporter